MTYDLDELLERKAYIKESIEYLGMEIAELKEEDAQIDKLLKEIEESEDQPANIFNIFDYIPKEDKPLLDKTNKIEYVVSFREKDGKKLVYLIAYKAVKSTKRYTNVTSELTFAYKDGGMWNRKITGPVVDLPEIPWEEFIDQFVVIQNKELRQGARVRHKERVVSLIFNNEGQIVQNVQAAVDGHVIDNSMTYNNTIATRYTGFASTNSETNFPIKDTINH